MPVKHDLGRFAMVPDWLIVPSTPPLALKLWAYLWAYHADRDTREAAPSRRAMARGIGTSPASIDRCLRDLERAGAITIEQRSSPAAGRIPSLITLRFNASPMRVGGSPVISGPSASAINALGTDDQGSIIQNQLPESDDIASTPARLSSSRYHEAFGKRPTRALQTALNDLDLAHPAACLDWAFAKAAGAARPNFNYAAAVLAACAAEGHGPREFTKGTYANGKTSGPSAEALARYPVNDGWQH